MTVIHLANNEKILSLNSAILDHGPDSLSHLGLVLVDKCSINVPVTCWDGCFHRLCDLAWGRLRKGEGWLVIVANRFYSQQCPASLSWLPGRFLQGSVCSSLGQKSQPWCSGFTASHGLCKLSNTVLWQKGSYSNWFYPLVHVLGLSIWIIRVIYFSFCPWGG